MKKYTRATKPGERVFVDTAGTFPESIIGNSNWIGVEEDYNHYS